VDYCTENIPDATPVVNPAYRRVDREVRRAVGKLGRQRAKFAALMLEGDIEQRDEQVKALKAMRKETQK